MATTAARSQLTVGIALSAALGGVAVFLLALLWSGFWAGLTLSVLWGWFVAPFFGVPTLSVWHAYGLVLLARAVAPWRQEKKATSFGSDMAGVFIAAPVVAGLLLLIGWMVKHWA